MTKNTIWTVVITLFVVVMFGIVGGYFYLSHTKTTIEAVRQSEGTSGGNGASGGLVSSNDLPPLQKPATSTNSTNNPLNPTIENVPALRKIYTAPVAGSDIFSRKEGTTTQSIIRFVDHATGNIFETSTSSLETVRITNTTIPKIYEAMFGADSKSVGNIALLRYTDNNENIQTFIGKTSGTSTDLNGDFGPQNAQSLVFSPSKNRFFYVQNNGNGATGYISDLGNKQSAILNHPLTEWLTSWPNESSLVLTTKPSSIASGVAYQLNTKGGRLNKLIGPKNGLVVLSSPKIDTLLFSESHDGVLRAGFYNLKNGSEGLLSTPTIPDKCVWGASGLVIYCGLPKQIPHANYPDSWYQSITSFNDVIVSIDPTTLQITSLVDPQVVVGEGIDAVDLHLSVDGNYLLFTNKKDLSLWGLRLR